MTCPHCERSDSVEPGSTVDVGHCTSCGMSWAVSLGNPRPLPVLADPTATADVGLLRWCLRKVITLADEAPGLTDAQLRAKLLALAVVLRPGPPRPPDEGAGSP